MSQPNQNELIESTLARVEPAVMLSALHASMGQSDPDGSAALEEIAQALLKAGVNCGPKACISGFVQRQMLNYAGNQVVRQLHQSLNR